LRNATVFHLAFDYHVHELGAARNDACTTKTSEAQHRSAATPDGTMVLLHDVVRLLFLADPDRRLTFSALSAARSDPLLSIVTVSGSPFWTIAFST
jgi:hypothetical protein